MKLFTFIVFVPAFWPILLDGTVGGLTTPLPTTVSPTPTRPLGYASYTRTAVLQVLPTTRMAHHNNGGQSAGWADSTVSIWTASQVYPARGVVGTGHNSLGFAHRNFHAAWSRACHWWQADSVWLVDAVVTIASYLLVGITIGVTLLSKATIERRATVSQPLRKHAFVSTTTTSIEGSLARGVHALVTHKQLPINTFTLEGRLVLSFGPSTTAGPVEWTVLFHPHQYYLATGSATQPSDRNPEPDVADVLLNKLFRQVRVYHPWTWYTQGILVNVPKQVGKEIHTKHKPTSVRSIPWIGDAPKSNDIGPKTQRRMIVARAVRRPTFAPSITRLGGLPKPPVQQHVLPGRPHHPAQWIEKVTLEGRLLMYAGSTPPGQPVNWVIQFRPYSGYHLTMHGDDSSNRQPEFMNGRLFYILMRQGSAYPPSVVYVPDTILYMLGERVKRSNNLTVPGDSLDLISTITNASPSAPRTPDIITIIEYREPLVTTVTSPVQLDASDPEASVALNLRKNSSSFHRTHEFVSADAKEDDDKSGEFFDYPNSHTPDSDEVEHFTPFLEAPTSPNPTSLDSTSDDVIREQKAAVLHELRSLLPMLEERAHREGGLSGLR